MNRYNKRPCCMSNNVSNIKEECDDDNMEQESPCMNICHTHTQNCDCGFDMDDSNSVFPSNPQLAQSYVPIQKMNKVFDPACGLKMGTIFPELVSPYYPGQSIQEIEYLRATNTIGEGCNK